MLAEMEGTFIECRQKKSKKDIPYRVFSVWSAESYERIDFFLEESVVIPDTLKSGQKVKFQVGISQRGFNMNVVVRGIGKN